MSFKKIAFLLLRIGKLIKKPVPYLQLIQKNLSFFDKFIFVPKGFSIQKSSQGGTKVEIIQSLITPPSLTIFYLHGGGFILGLNNVYRKFGCLLAKACAAKVILIDYSLAPEQPFPIALDQSLNAYKALLYSQNASSIVVAGDSAGGNLALSTLLAAKETGLSQPLCAVIFSGWLDLRSKKGLKIDEKKDPLISVSPLSNVADAYLQGCPAGLPLASPLHGNLKGLPPLFLHVGAKELLLDDMVLLAQKAQDQEVPVQLEISPDMIHVQPILFPKDKRSLRIINKIADFINLNLRSSTR